MSNFLTVCYQIPRKSQRLLRKPVLGTGGFQTLLRRLQKKITGMGRIQLTPEEIAKICKYSTKYGQSGYSGRLSVFKPIVDELSDLCVRIHTECF